MHHPFARPLRNNPTEAERFLWQFLRKRQIDGFKFRRQQPIGRYVVDFVCLDRRLIIELDGGHHAVQKRYDRMRDGWLTDEGYRVLRFWNNEVMRNVEGVVKIIKLQLIGTATPTRPPVADALPPAGGGRNGS